MEHLVHKAKKLSEARLCQNDEGGSLKASHRSNKGQFGFKENNTYNRLRHKYIKIQEFK